MWPRPSSIFHSSPIATGSLKQHLLASLALAHATMGSILVPFLTDLDSRARVKGSRDPLGAQPIWTKFGRYVVGNLTTVSSSLRDFTTLMLGYYFADRVAENLGASTALDTFLKWEQLAAYS